MTCPCCLARHGERRVLANRKSPERATATNSGLPKKGQPWDPNTGLQGYETV